MTKQLIDGKEIKDLAGLPHMGFTELVREELDPLWGRDDLIECEECGEEDAPENMEYGHCGFCAECC